MAHEKNSIEELAARIREKEATRTIHTYVIPKGLQTLGARSVGIIELSADEEMQAQKRARNDVVRMTYELAKESLRELDGKRLSSADGSLDRAWAGLHPKLRTLVVTAYSEIHNPNEGDAADFLKSRQITVG